MSESDKNDEENKDKVKAFESINDGDNWEENEGGSSEGSPK